MHMQSLHMDPHGPHLLQIKPPCLLLYTDVWYSMFQLLLINLISSWGEFQHLLVLEARDYS